MSDPISLTHSGRDKSKVVGGVRNEYSEGFYQRLIFKSLFQMTKVLT